VLLFFRLGDRKVEILTEKSLAAGAVFGAQGPGRRQDRPMRAMRKPSGAESRAAGLTTGGVYIQRVRESKKEILVN